MGIDHVFAVAIALAIATIVLIVLGQAIGQFNNVLKTVLRSQKEGSDRNPVKVWLLTPTAVVIAIGTLSLLAALLAW
jgi:heme/copper-type cytochrome/quinol oxidase subunit 1